MRSKGHAARALHQRILGPECSKLRAGVWHSSGMQTAWLLSPIYAPGTPGKQLALHPLGMA